MHSHRTTAKKHGKPELKSEVTHIYPI